MTDNMGIVFPLEPEGKEELLPCFSQRVARVTDLVHQVLCAKNSLQLSLTNRSFQAFHHILQTEQHSQTTYFSSLLTFLIHQCSSLFPCTLILIDLPPFLALPFLLSYLPFSSCFLRLHGCYVLRSAAGIDNQFCVGLITLPSPPPFLRPQISQRGPSPPPCIKPCLFLNVCITPHYDPR